MAKGKEAKSVKEKEKPAEAAKPEEAPKEAEEAKPAAPGVKGAEPAEEEAPKEEKKKEKKSQKERPKSKKKHTKIQIWKLYEVKDGSLARKNEPCPRCGAGTFLATYKERKYCGKCGWSQLPKKDEEKK